MAKVKIPFIICTVTGLEHVEYRVYYRRFTTHPATFLASFTTCKAADAAVRNFTEMLHFFGLNEHYEFPVED